MTASSHWVWLQLVGGKICEETENVLLLFLSFFSSVLPPILLPSFLTPVFSYVLSSLLPRSTPYICHSSFPSFLLFSLSFLPSFPSPTLYSPFATCLSFYVPSFSFLVFLFFFMFSFLPSFLFTFFMISLFFFSLPCLPFLSFIYLNLLLPLPFPSLFPPPFFLAFCKQDFTIKVSKHQPCSLASNRHDH